MDTPRERLDSAGMLAAFEEARRAGDRAAMRSILERSGFRLLEIEPILRSPSEIGPPLTDESQRKRLVNKVVARLSIALVSGLLLGGFFVYQSASSPAARNGGEATGQVARADYRSPKEAYYKPFALGFVIGAIGGLITGGLIYDPFSRKG